MKPYYVVTVSKDGSLYIPKLTTSYLGILGWSGVAIKVEDKYILMRFCKSSIDAKMGEIAINLKEKSGGRQAMRGCYRKLAEAIKEDFGDANCLDLKFNLFNRFNTECVKISIERPSRVVENLARNEEMLSSVELAHPITRPLPEGLPDWLSGPLSRGEQVLVSTFDGEEKVQGWVIGVNSKRGITKIAVTNDIHPSQVSMYHLEFLFPSQGTLKQPAECFKIAFKIAVDRKIGLTLPQISAIINGGIPPEGHGLPDEMFE